MTRRDFLENQFKNAKKQSKFWLYLKVVFWSYFKK